MKRYKVRFYQDNQYEVIEIITIEIPNGVTAACDYDTREVSVYKGSLADCEAWIRLHESGYMD